MSVRYLNKLVAAVCQSTVQALDHQVSAYRILFIALILGFLVSILIVPTELAIGAFMLPMSYIMAFTQLNHCMADELTDLSARIRQQLVEAIDNLRQQMSIWRHLINSLLAVNPRPEISFFDRLSDLLSLTQLPLLGFPLAFRS